jgi:hypothetical protein
MAISIFNWRLVTNLAISRDTGASFPIIAGQITGPVTTVDTATFNVTAAASLIVVRVALGNYNAANWWTPTCVWIGGTPANASAFTSQIDWAMDGAGSYRVAIFTATVSGALTGVSVRAGGTNSAADIDRPAISVAVDALVNASATMGTSGGVGAISTPFSPQVALTGVVAGSWIFAAAAGENYVVSTVPDFSPVSGTTEDAGNDRHNAAANAGTVTGVNTTGTSGSVTAGWASGGIGGTAVALEVQASRPLTIASVTSGTATTTATVVVTPASIPSGAVVVALYSCWANPTGVPTSTNLTFTQRASVEQYSGTNTAYIFTAVAGADLSNEAISSTAALSIERPTVSIVVLTGANTGALTNTATASASSASASVTVTAAGPASWVLGSLAGYGAGETNASAGASTTELYNEIGANIALHCRNTTAGSGSTTLAATLTGTSDWVFAAIEIQ